MAKQKTQKTLTREFPDYIVELNDSGVLYVHDKNTGTTIVRIGGLDRPKPEPVGQQQKLIDIAMDFRERRKS